MTLRDQKLEEGKVGGDALSTVELSLARIFRDLASKSLLFLASIKTLSWIARVKAREIERALRRERFPPLQLMQPLSIHEPINFAYPQPKVPSFLLRSDRCVEAQMGL